jgi:GDP-4-dehydro-6-deoxy-D-mannose reductase
MKRVLVTGGGGFVGQWLARALLRRGDDVALAELEGAHRTQVLDDEERRAVRWVALDVRDAQQVSAAVDATTPDVVVHLAGVAFPPEGEHDPAATYDVNTLGAVRLLADLGRRRAAGTLDPAIVIVGSGVQYGDHGAREMPLREDAAQRPLTIYAASKAAQEVAALQMARAHGLRVVCTRSFNHSGIGHGPRYLLPSLVRRVVALPPGGAPRLALGNDVVRDYLHVADVADAYIALADRGAPGEAYNVASGIGLSVRQLARDVLLRAGVDADISTDPALVRASDLPVLVGSPDKLTRATGWTPARTHLDIIDDLLRSAHAATH